MKMGYSRRWALLGAVALAGLGFAGGAQAQNKPLKLGILNDQSSAYSDLTGRGTVVAGQMAIEDFGGSVNGRKIEMISADHQNKADVGVAMQTGTPAAREAGNMIDLDSDPTKLIEIVSIGKQLLMTRGSVTTFSVANDVAKYFAILPAMFVALYPGLGMLNIMALGSPKSAILSAIVFNALIILALIPLALRGVKWRAAPAGQLLARNLAIYGVGGLVAPFIGIKLIDLVISSLGLV